MSSRALLASLPVAVFVFLLLSLVQAGPGLVLFPNSSIEAGSTALFNLSMNNTNNTLNITAVNITLPSGFSFIQGSNQSSSQEGLFQNSTILQWLNLTQEGFIENLTQGWLAFNSTVNTNPGNYNFTVDVTFTDYSTNQSIITVTVNDTTPPSGLTFLQAPANGSWSNSSWFIVNLTFQELNPDTCLLDLGNGSQQNWSMQMTGSMCWFNASNQSQGSHNWSVWINDTSGNLAWNGTWLLNIGSVPRDLEPSGTTPQNGSVIGRSWFEANFTFTEHDPDTCLLYLDNGSVQSLNMSLNASEGFCYLNVTGQGEGHLNYSLWINTTAGAYNQSDWYHLTIDLTPTVISGVTVNESYTTTNINWSTSFPADSLVEYGSGNQSNLTLNVTNSTMDTSHMVILGNLSEGTEYFFNITCCDNLSICNTSGTWNFTTLTTLCTENWSYGAWSECSGGTQTRSATDLNSCGTTDNRSALSRSCDDGGGGGGGGSSSETYHTATKIWSNIKPGIPATMEIDVPGIAATSVTVEVSESVRTSNMIVRGFSIKPSEIGAVPEGRVHSYMNITTTVNRSRISRAVVEFYVESSWTEGLGIEPSSVRLMRLAEEWEELDTIFLGSDGGRHSFRADVAGFSWFAITGQPIQNETGSPEDGTSEPGPTEQEPGGETPGQPAAPDVEWELCTPGEAQCVAGVIRQLCNGDGNGWVNKETCYYGCMDGECSDTFVIEIDINQFLVGVGVAVVIIVLALIYIKRKDIDDFLFWRL